MKQLFLLLLLSTFLNSCGLFLQQSGVKNYRPAEKISGQQLNKYQYDFLYLTHLLEDGYPNLETVFPAKKRAKQIELSLQALGQDEVDAVQFSIHARKYLSYVKNQHTTISLDNKVKRFYPFFLSLHDNAWYLLNLETTHDSSHLGKQVLAINGFPMKTVEHRLIAYTFSENSINQQQELAQKRFFNLPEFLRAARMLSEHQDTIALYLEDGTRIVIASKGIDEPIQDYNITIPKDSLTAYRPVSYTYQLQAAEDFAYLQFNKCHDKIDMLDALESYVKPWMQPMARGYLNRQFKKEKPAQQVADYYNPKDPIFRDFVWKMVDSLNENNIGNLVIDLRYNGGGNLELGVQLLYFLTAQDKLQGFSEYAYTSPLYQAYFPAAYAQLAARFPEGVPQDSLLLVTTNTALFKEITDTSSAYYIPINRPIFKGNVYVLANYNTGSAAALLTTLFQDHGIGTVIGTSVGNNPIGATTLTPMQLPKTKAKVSIASTYTVRPKPANGVEQIPDYWVDYTLEQYLQGVDPYLQKAKVLMGRE